MRETITFWHDRRIYRVDARLTKKEARRLLEGGAPVIVRPIEGQKPCPFKVHDRFEIAPHHLWIEVTKVTAKAGEWRVGYRIIDFRPNLMGNKAGFTTDQRRAIKTVDTDEKGQRRKEPEYVEDGWHDVGKEKREEMRLQAVKEVKHDELRDRKVRQIKAKLSMVGAWEIQHGVDSLPTLDRIYEELEALDPGREIALGKAA